MKKTLMSLLTIGAVAVIAVVATRAFFSDTETSTGNIFRAGAIDLKVDSEAHYAGLVCDEGGIWRDEGNTTRPELVGQKCGGTWEQTDLGPSHRFFDYTDVKPGDPGENTISLHTTNDAWMCANLNVTSNSDGEGGGSVVDSLAVDFESPTYSLGNINGQDGWTFTGPYDVEVDSSLGTSGFASQSFRISDAVTSGSFGDWAFAKPLTDSVGETGSTNGAFAPGTKQNHFETEFDIASAVPGSEQSGLFVSMAPDRGDGSRMSYLGYGDEVGGIHVIFYDVTNPGPLGTVSSFNLHDLGFYDRTVPHHVKLTMDTPDGAANDVVKVWIDGVLKVTGTSWEDYYRYDPEAIAEQSPRIVKTLIFQARGTAHPANSGNGFLFDNLSLKSGSNLSGGALADGVEFYAWRDNGDNIHQDGEVGIFGPLPIGFGSPTSFAIADSLLTPALPANVVNYIGLAWCAGNLTVEVDGTLTCDGSTLGNEAQNDSMTADISFYAEQSRNNSGFVCSGL